MPESHLVMVQCHDVLAAEFMSQPHPSVNGVLAAADQYDDPFSRRTVQIFKELLSPKEFGPLEARAKIADPPSGVGATLEALVPAWKDASAAREGQFSGHMRWL
jgi:hypothetical protein